MTICAEKTVREYALEQPSATRVFAKLKIDYCCGGGRPLSEAARLAGVPLEEVGRLLEEAESHGAVPAGLESGTLSGLIDYILDKHHAYTREEMGRVTALADKVASKHGERRPELLSVRTLFRQLCEDLRPHMMKEELMLFPYVKQLEWAAAANLPAPRPPFGAVNNPVRVMMLEHDAAGDILRELRAAAGDYVAPEDACTSYRTLYHALEAFEQDLHQHVHLENNVLFPAPSSWKREVWSRESPRDRSRGRMMSAPTPVSLLFFLSREGGEGFRVVDGEAAAFEADQAVVL